LEKRRPAEGRISRNLFQSIGISRARFILRGVGLSHPNFHKDLKLAN
jgi:hypothetical protein